MYFVLAFFRCRLRSFLSSFLSPSHTSSFSSFFIHTTHTHAQKPLPVDEEAGVLRADPALGFEHPYPPTRVAFIPDRSGSSAAAAAASSSSSGNTPDLLATSGDFLRIWKIESGGDDVFGNDMATDEYEDGEDEDGDGGGSGGGAGNGGSERAAARRRDGRRRRRSVADAGAATAAAAATSGLDADDDDDDDDDDIDGDNGNGRSGPRRRSGGGAGARRRRTRLLKLLNNNKHSEFCAPLTSFDWNDADARRLGTASIDTTCTIWDVERGVVDTQLIAHDREVFDIAWGGVGVFASVSADGSVRVFDLRDKEHSTIIYESPTPDNTPLLRLAWNRQDPRYMACLAFDSSSVAVLDIRFPAAPAASLARHAAPANALAWAPYSSCHICTAGDDAQALIWDLSAMARPASVVAGGSAGAYGGGGLTTTTANGNNSSAGMGGGGSRGGGGGGGNGNRSGGTATTPGVSDPQGMGGGGGGGGGGGNPTATMSNTTTGGGGGGGGGNGVGPAGGAAAAAVTGLDPILAYSAGAEICGLQWSSAAPDWVAICFANKMQILRV